MPSSLCAAPRLKSRSEATLPFHWNGLITRSASTPRTPAVLTLVRQPRKERSRVTWIEPKLTPLASSRAVRGKPVAQTLAIASERMRCSSAVISSATRCTAPGANRCGVLRSMNCAGTPPRSGSRCTLAAALPAASSVGRLWQALQLSAFGPVSRAGR